MPTHSRLPSLFIPHGGGPCFFMAWEPADTWTAMARYLGHIADTLPTRPRAILVVSAHWEAPAFTVGSGTQPDLIYDYFGFPPHTYELTYPARGNPVLAERVRSLLDQAGFETASDPVRGYDHGVFIPLKVTFPEADIPVVQLSLRADYSPRAHFDAGRALAPLRDEGVLIVGSGMSFHNMRGFREPSFRAAAHDMAEDFDAWLSGVIAEPDPDRRRDALMRWEQAPSARLAHPPRGEEHLLPLFVAAGAGGEDAGHRDFSELVMNMRISGYRFGA